MAEKVDAYDVTERRNSGGFVELSFTYPRGGFEFCVDSANSHLFLLDDFSKHLLRLEILHDITDTAPSHVQLLQKQFVAFLPGSASSVSQ